MKEKLEEDRRSRRMALGLPPELSEEEKAAEAAKEAAKVAAEAAKKLPVKSVSVRNGKGERKRERKSLDCFFFSNEKEKKTHPLFLSFFLLFLLTKNKNNKTGPVQTTRDPGLDQKGRARRESESMLRDPF